MRSTPTPKDCLRTVNVSRAPWPWRLMTTPSKTWMRRRVPSITWKCTFTRSPGANVGHAAQLRSLEGVDDGAHGVGGCAHTRMPSNGSGAARNGSGRGLRAVPVAAAS